MSYQEISSKHVVAKKDYQCSWCGEGITKGEKHLSRSYKMEGNFQSDRQHLECEKAMMSMKHDDICDGYQFGEFKRGTCEAK